MIQNPSSISEISRISATVGGLIFAFLLFTIGQVRERSTTLRDFEIEAWSSDEAAAKRRLRVQRYFYKQDRMLLALAVIALTILLWVPMQNFVFALNKVSYQYYMLNVFELSLGLFLVIFAASISAYRHLVTLLPYVSRDEELSLWSPFVIVSKLIERFHFIIKFLIFVVLILIPGVLFSYARNDWGEMITYFWGAILPATIAWFLTLMEFEASGLRDLVKEMRAPILMLFAKNGKGQVLMAGEVRSSDISLPMKEMPASVYLTSHDDATDFAKSILAKAHAGDEIATKGQFRVFYLSSEEPLDGVQLNKGLNWMFPKDIINNKRVARDIRDLISWLETSAYRKSHHYPPDWQLRDAKAKLAKGENAESLYS